MILVDTSVWIDHFRQGVAELSHRLETIQVAMHPFVVGEIACGHLRNRQKILQLFQNLPKATPATEIEVLEYIETHKLMGKGLGYIDMHLLAATALTSDCKLWSYDRKLALAADELGMGIL